MQEQSETPYNNGHAGPLGEPEVGNWRSIGEIAQGMILAWNEAEERERVSELVTYTTERQRSRIWQELWRQGSVSWRERAVRWMSKDAAK